MGWVRVTVGVLVCLVPARVAVAADLDGDGVDDSAGDNCPGVANPSQADTNLDGHGDACVHPSVFVPPTTTLGWGVTIGLQASVGATSTYADRVTVGAKATVGAAGVFGADGVVGRRAQVGSGALIGSFFSFAADTLVGNDLDAPFSALVLGYGATLGDRVQVTGTDVVVGNLAHVGDDTTLGAGSRFGRSSVIGAFVTVEAGAQIGPDVQIDDHAVVRAGAVLRSGVEVGAWATVGADARLGRGVVVGASASVGERARIGAASLLQPNAVVEDDAILPRGSVVGASAPLPSVSWSGPLTFQVNEWVPPTAPTVVNGPITSCAVTPTLPTGLTLASDCTFAGTPTAVTAAATYTITPTNALGAGSPTAVSVAVTPDPCVGSLLTNTPFAGGTGTAGDPFQICTTTQFLQLATSSSYFGSQFRLMRSLDFTSVTYQPVGLVASFSGVFDGNHRTLANITYGTTTTDYAAPFRYLDGSAAVIRNLRVTGATVTGRTYVSAVAGALTNGARVENSFASGTIATQTSGTGHAGVVGWCSGCAVTDTTASVTVVGSGSAGGLVGEVTGGATLLRDRATGNVTGGGGGKFGGLVGSISGTSRIEDCVASGNITSTASYNGGLVGYATGAVVIARSSASGSVSGPTSGGLVGYLDVGGVIRDASASGAVSGSGSTGGLVGVAVANTIVARSSASGAVSGATSVGGLIGDSGAHIARSAATGTVTATGSNSGGLVGTQATAGSIMDSYARGNVAGKDFSGGLVGMNERPIARAYATGNLTGSGVYRGGLVGYVTTTASVHRGFATGTLTGSSPGAVIGYISGTPVLVDLHALDSGRACAGSGTLACTQHASVSDFYATNAAPASGWDFTYTWSPANAGTAFPTLRPTPPTTSTCTAPQIAATPFSGAGTLADPFVICTVDQWLAMSTNAATLSGTFELRADLDFSGHTFAQPDTAVAFTGVFDGNDHVVLHPRFGSATTDYVGLFRYLDGSAATIRDLRVIGATMAGRTYVATVAGALTNGARVENVDAQGVIGQGDTNGHGGVVGYCLACTVADSTAFVDVFGTTQIGGLVGYRDGNATFARDSASGTVVSSTGKAGGLVGFASGPGLVQDCTSSARVDSMGTMNGGLIGQLAGATRVTGSSATGAVTGDNSGGLIGQLENGASILDSFATGAVSSTTVAGGLVGTAGSNTRIARSRATGAVSGGNSSGGLVGDSSADIHRSYATGAVSGLTQTGGLVGYQFTTGAVADSYATGAVNGTSYTGGLVGRSDRPIVWSYSTGNVTGSGNYRGGLVGYTASNAVIAHVFTTGTVTGGSNLGALVGYASGNPNAPVIDAHAKTDGARPCTSNGTVPCTLRSDDTWYHQTTNAPLASWDFGFAWSNNNAGVGFPTLRATAPVTSTCSPSELAATPFAGAGTLADPFVICSTTQFLAMATNAATLSGRFSLKADLDFAGLAYTQPDTATSFTGVFDGNGHVITGVHFGGATTDYVGVFRYLDGASATVENLDVRSVVAMGRTYVSAVAGALTNGARLEDVVAHGVVGLPAQAGHGGAVGYCAACVLDHVTAKVDVAGTTSTGGLAGEVTGAAQISFAVASGHVRPNGANAGGLIGSSSGALSMNDSSASGTVVPSAGTGFGGAVGWMAGGQLTRVTASGAVSGSNAGGLVGTLDNASTVVDSAASGSVTSTSTAGGLVGTALTGSSIQHSSATGPVSGAGNVGGLVGESSATVTKSWATGAVSTTGSQSGGFVGYQTLAGSITDCWASGVVTGSDFSGGFAGRSERPISRSYATGALPSGGGFYRGGFAGYISGSGSLTDVFATGTVTSGSSRGSLVGYVSGAPAVTNAHVLTSALPCAGGGTASCTSHSPISYFYDVSSAPLAQWDFGSVWSPTNDDVAFPALR
jgi:UDP-3-O-[3-hydroxymyristoyl] glucosamine N-acyltransferase